MMGATVRPMSVLERIRTLPPFPHGKTHPRLRRGRQDLSGVLVKPRTLRSAPLRVHVPEGCPTVLRTLLGHSRTLEDGGTSAYRLGSGVEFALLSVRIEVALARPCLAAGTRSPFGVMRPPQAPHGHQCAAPFLPGLSELFASSGVGRGKRLPATQQAARW
jgi:hypothetical protein